MQLLRDPVRASDVPPWDTDVLIREARRLRRRRWLAGIASVIVAAAGIGIGLGVAGSGGAHAGAIPRAATDVADPVTLQPGVTMLNLTKSDKYSDIAVVGKQLLLYGPQSGAIEPSLSATCAAAIVDPSTLALSNLRSGSCADPSLQGKTVLPVMTIERNTPFGKGGGVATVTVRISHVVGASPGYRVGPVVMTFPQASGGAPESVYGDGDLWLYDSYNPGGYDLLRISEATGDVVQKLKVPAITSPVMAFDDDGLWLSPGVDSSSTPDAVYHLAPGSTDAVPVLTFTRGADEYATWMVASGHSLYFCVDSGGKTFTLWHLVGAAATRSTHVLLPESFGNEVEGQGSASTMVGGASGLWTVLPTISGSKQQVIIGLDPSSGLSSTIASVKPGYSTTNEVLYDAWQGVTYKGAMYLLDPPTSSGTYPYQAEGFSALYRVTSRSK